MDDGKNAKEHLENNVTSVIDMDVPLGNEELEINSGITKKNDAENTVFEKEDISIFGDGGIVSVPENGIIVITTITRKNNGLEQDRFQNG